MLTFLFWNMGGELPERTPTQFVQQRHARIGRAVGNLLRMNDVDVLAVAECPISDADLLREMNRVDSDSYGEPNPLSQCRRVRIYTRKALGKLDLLAESAQFTCRQIRHSRDDGILLFAAHFASKQRRSEASQTLAMPRFGRTIRDVEKRVRHDRTVVVGDLNMNPFDPGVVGGEALNAVMTKQIARRGTRRVDAVPYPFFYNPMWSHFGDSTHEQYPPGDPRHEPPGTCYFPAAESRWHYWNMYDQVLLRPSLLPSFRHRDLKILVTDGNERFVDENGLPKTRFFSDHLPILLKLDA